MAISVKCFVYFLNKLNEIIHGLTTT